MSDEFPILSKGPFVDCRDCDFRGQFSDAVGHVALTGHTILFHGKAQDVSRLLRERQDRQMPYPGLIEWRWP